EWRQIHRQGGMGQSSRCVFRGRRPASRRRAGCRAPRRGWRTMKLAARVENLHKIYDLGPALPEPKATANEDLEFAPLTGDAGRILVKALRGVTLDFPEGDFVAIMGASGSGKSTLLNLLGGLDRPTTGKYVLDGVDVSQMDDAELSHVRNQKLGFIFQSYNLIA